MLAFNVKEFSVINKMCEGTSSTHRHERWGLTPSRNTFATALETAYPMPLAKMIATQFVVALQRIGIAMPHGTLAQISQHDGAVLSALRAQVGNQPRASRLPPLIPQFAAKLAITGFREDLPAYEVNHKLSSSLAVRATNAPTSLPKGAKLLQSGTALLPSNVLQGGAFVSGQHLSQEEVERVAEIYKCQDVQRDGFCETQVWGVPWSEQAFAEQMVLFGHPSKLEFCLPQVLKDAVYGYKSMEERERMSYRASKLGYWLKVMMSLKEDEKRLKRDMDGDVAKVLGSKNIWLVGGHVEVDAVQ